MYFCEMVQILIVVKGVKSFQYQDLVIMTPHFKCQNITWNETFRLLFMTARRSRTVKDKILFMTASFKLHLFYNHFQIYLHGMVSAKRYFI